MHKPLFEDPDWWKHLDDQPPTPPDEAELQAMEAYDKKHSKRNRVIDYNG